MNDNTIIKAMANIDEKYIREAEDIAIFRRKIIKRQKRRFTAFVLLILSLILFCISDHAKTSAGENNAYEYETVGCAHLEMKINEATEVLRTDMDVKVENIAAGGQFTSALVGKYYEKAGIDYDRIISSVPDEYGLSELYCIKSPFVGGVKQDEYVPHDYGFVFEGSDGKLIEIRLCPFEETLSDCIIISDDVLTSEVATEEVIITSFAGTYYAEFDINGIYYHIEGRNITATELADMLINIVAAGGMNE